MMTTPFNKCFLFNTPKTFNSGPIEGIPTVWTPKWIMGSVLVKSYNKDHVNYLLGDSKGEYDSTANAKQTWWGTTDTRYEPVINFGSKLVAFTNQGDGDQVVTYHGTWSFMMIPLKSDFTFDIVPSGQNDGTYDKICFNLIAFA